MEKLLNAGANPDATNSYGYAPLHVAASAGQTAIVEALLTAGADPGVVPSETSNSDQTLKYCAGMTPLHFAAHGGYAESIDALVAAGADANAADATGITPMYWSEKAGHVDATISLLGGGRRHSINSRPIDLMCAPPAGVASGDKDDRSSGFVFPGYRERRTCSYA